MIKIVTPRSSAAGISFLRFASAAYHGGYNGSFAVGFFSEETYDYDLKNAYPTSMCLVPDINWEDPIETEIIDRELKLTEVHTKTVAENASDIIEVNKELIKLVLTRHKTNFFKL